MADPIVDLLASVPFSARAGTEGKDIARMLAERAAQRYLKSIDAQEGFKQANEQMFTARSAQTQSPEPPMPALDQLPPAEEDSY